MKKILLSLAVVALGYSAQAQEGYGFNQGDIMLEGSIRYNTTDDKATEIKENTFNFTPQVGYFISDKFAAGLYFDLSSNKVDNYSGTTNINKTNAFNVGVFWRYYFLELGQRFKFYGQANVGFANAKNTIELANVPTIESKGSGVNAGLDLGVNYFITPKIAINFGFANLVDYTTTKPKGGKAQNDFNMNINNFNNFFDAATFGLTFKF